MAYANVKLSKSELILVCDEQFILTKNAVIEKVYFLFGALGTHFSSQKEELSKVLPKEVLIQSPKIYKGEQYKRLPYVMLDYPRCFTKDDAFTIRCFFWWGNFFSITLHLQGKYAQEYAVTVLNNMQVAGKSDWSVCVNENKWEHHFGADNYLPATKETIASVYSDSKPFLKIAKKIPLSEWDGAYDFFVESYSEILEIISAVNRQ